ncbi:pilus assembly protein [Escherichia coli]|nr:pilus assembly protein [Escherichia coli]
MVNAKELISPIQFLPWINREKGNDSNLLIVFYVQIMPDDLVMQLHRF